MKKLKCGGFLAATFLSLKLFPRRNGLIICHPNFGGNFGPAKKYPNYPQTPSRPLAPPPSPLLGCPSGLSKTTPSPGASDSPFPSPEAEQKKIETSTEKSSPHSSQQGKKLWDRQPYTATTKDFGSKKGFQRGWCTNCQNLREQQNVYHPQDCTGDVHHGFCGGGARIMGFEKFITWNQQCAN